MKKEFIVERQGRSFVLYCGLLDMAHQHGLKSIRTELLQVPSDANKGVAICMATVVMEKDGNERVFTGIGDAAVNNVAPAMATCLIRMAETRSKARALRDAVNVGVAAFEELGEDDAQDGAPERGYAVGGARAARYERGGSPRNANGNGMPARAPASRSAESTAPAAEQQNTEVLPIMEAQTKAIQSLCRSRGLDPDTLAKEKFTVEKLENLNRVQASEIIRSLNERSNGRTPVASTA